MRVTDSPVNDSDQRTVESCKPHLSVPLCVFRTVLIGVLCVWNPNSSVAQQPGRDRVQIQRKGTSSRIGLRGRIIDYTGKKLTLITLAGRDVQEFPADEVISVKTSQTEPHIRGLAAFTNRRFQQAETEFEKSLLEETRTWVRREILSMLIRCDLKQGDLTSAGTRFLILVRSDPETRHFKLIPLIWSERTIKRDFKNAARGWLHGKLDVERLLGASILLDDRDDGTRAGIELESLATCTNLNVRLLARTQLWRIKFREGNFRRDELVRWKTSIESLPESLRGGPYFLLALGHLERREKGRAATAFLWLPLVYDHDHFLAAQACLEAAHALFDMGRHAEAMTLYREITVRFANTPSENIATDFLNTVASPQKN
jgi:hypothetical protein